MNEDKKNKQDQTTQEDQYTPAEGSLGGEASQSQEEQEDTLGDLDYYEEDVIGIVGPESVTEDVSDEEL